MSNTLELVIQELQNRIGQITSQYETQMAVLKVQANEALQAKDEEIKQLKESKLHAEPVKKEK
jgi:acetolactate synthase small subunit